MQDNQVSQSSEPKEKPKLYFQRWLVLIFFILAVFMNSLPGEIYVPAADDTEQIYATSETMVTLASTSYVIMHPILSIPCSQFIVKYGWASATNIGVTLTILGSAIKLLVNKTGFYMIILGQILIGAGKPFILNSQASMAQSWFYPESRPAIIIILNVLNLISNLVTLMIPGKWIFRNYDYEDTPESIDEGKQLMDKLNLVQLYMILTLIPCYLFLRNQAPTPPSNLGQREEKSTNIIRVMKKLLTNHNFIWCLLAYSVYLGLVKSLVLILSFIIKASGHGKQQVSVAGAVANAAAALSQASLAAFIQKFTNVKTQLIKVLMVFSTASLLLFFFSLDNGNIYFIYFAIGTVGFFIMPIAPVLMDISCDVAFPTSPSYAIATMYIGSQLLLVLFTQLSAILVGGSQSTMTRVGYTLFTDMGLQLLGLLLFSFIRLSRGNVVKSTHSLIHSEVQESFMNGRSQLEQGQAIKSSYVGTAFFNLASGIAFIGITPAGSFSNNALSQKKSQIQYSSEIGEWDNNSQQNQRN